MKTAHFRLGKILLLAAAYLGWHTQDCSAGTLKQGDIIKLNRSGATGGAGGGGEFTIWKLISTGSAQDQWLSLGVQTFCLEFNEHITLNEKLLVGAISDRAVMGGVSGQDASGGDPLDPRTQYLYQSFITNNLASTGFQDGSDAWSNALQHAIWYLEGEVSSLTTSESQALYNFANAYKGGALSSVFALNLFSLGANISAFDPNNSSTWSALSSFRRQDQLFYQLPPPPPPSTQAVPEPNSSTLWLTGLCFLACCIRVRALSATHLFPGCKLA